MVGATLCRFSATVSMHSGVFLERGVLTKGLVALIAFRSVSDFDLPLERSVICVGTLVLLQ